jgi:thiol-disulfide isomerase/thioredoxin
LLTRCGALSGPAEVGPDQLEAAVQSTQAPLAVLFWADWSQPAVELLPTAAELAAEYEGEGLVFYTVSLGRPKMKDALGVLGRFPIRSRRFIVGEDPTAILTRFGLADIPSAIVCAPGGQVRERLGVYADAPLTPADLTDAIEAVLVK